jgi:ribonuclease P protein component
VLPAAHRLTGSDAFRTAVRSGRRAGSTTLVVHLATGGGPVPRVGFVVSKAVGNAVTRNRVKRRLRHLVREQLDSLPAGAALVVRAAPSAGSAGYAELREDLARCLKRAVAPRKRQRKEVSAS